MTREVIMLRHVSASAIAFAILLVLDLSALLAQQAQILTQRGPYYVGEPVMVQVLFESVDSKSDVTCELLNEPASGVTVEGPRVTRSVRSFTQIVNGRMSSRETIDHRFGFVVTATEEGEYDIGPFRVTTGGESSEVEGVRFRFTELRNDPDMQISISLPGETVYVGQEVPVTIRWSFAGDMDAVRYAFSYLQIRSPLFDQFTFVDAPATTRTTLSIVTAKGSVEVDAEVDREQINGREFIVVTGTRTLIPDAAGRFTAIPVTCRTQKATSFSRSLFGDLVARGQTPAIAAGEPLDLIVEPIPRNGRPDNFTGAVGKDFSIDVSANRSVIRVGDPIALNITIRGDGNLDSVSLPPLSAGNGLPSEHFQVPQDLTAGSREGNQKQFKVNLRVKDTAVTQIPAIGFSWFNPYEELFQSAASDPIAIQVMEAQLVSAADVVSSAPRPGQNGSQDADAATGNAVTGTSPGLTLVGANLAIVQDPSRLLAQNRSATVLWITTACYALALSLIAVSVAWRWSTGRDTAWATRRKRLKELLYRLDATQHVPPKEAAQEIARVLRDLLADYSVSDRRAVEQLIGRCDNIIYATSFASGSELPELTSAAKNFVQEASRK